MRVLIPATAMVLLLGASSASAQRTPDARPDLTGHWTNGTATPLQRPTEFKDKAHFTEAEATEWERTGLERLLTLFPEDDRKAADLNDIYLETSGLIVLADRRTSLIVDPADGRVPPPLPQAQARAAARPKTSFDDPETIGLDERCLMGTALGTSSAAPPMVPNPFGQNFYQIVQTPQYVMIYTELVHDARIIRMNAEHLQAGIQHWLGDSVGHWEADTLVVDTTNYSPKTHFRGSGGRLHVVERFTRTGADTIRYRATLEDPDTWATPWTVEIPFSATPSRIVEYACHEGNRAVENYMRGARAEEKK
jgi:hypothetical protein